MDPGGRGWEAEARELGAVGQEAGEIRMFNHWATGLRSGLLPQDCGVAPQEVGPKKAQILAKFSRGF